MNNMQMMNDTFDKWKVKRAIQQQGLTRNLYMEAKKVGMTDRQVMNAANIPNNRFYRWKADEQRKIEREERAMKRRG